jgi:hypothetical protein
MKVKFIEVTNGPQNWGKFMVAEFSYDDWQARSAIDNGPLIAGRGWTKDHKLVLDLQTGEGAIFKLGGKAKADLDKHRVWVCPLFEPFLEWLYDKEFKDLNELPAHVDLPDAPFAMSGYRRKGPNEQRTQEGD